MTDKMGIQEFGDQLIRTRDLDPLYVGLVGARARFGITEGQMARWLLAYWCFYHVGVASWVSEKPGDTYWDWMLDAAHNVHSPRDYKLPADRWPRAAERRHFRGQKCVDAVNWLRTHSRGDPEALVLSLVVPPPSLKPITDKDIMIRVQVWPMFGPWIAFKAADMLERVLGLPIEFDRNLGLMYAEPRAGLDLFMTVNNLIDPSPEAVYSRLLMYFSPRLAPPVRPGIKARHCGPQEVETILCKWKSYMGGHYHIGKDIHEQRAALRGWGRTAQALEATYPEEVQ